MQILVLKTLPYRESDLIVTFLSKEAGKQAAYAAGARNSKKRFPGGIEPFDLAEATISEGRGNLPRISEYSKNNAFPELRTSLEQYKKASAVLELSEILAPENDSSAGCLFDPACQALQNIAKTGKGWEDYAFEAIILSGFSDKNTLQKQMVESSLLQIITDITHKKLKSLPV